MHDDVLAMRKTMVTLGEACRYLQRRLHATRKQMIALDDVFGEDLCSFSEPPDSAPRRWVCFET